MVKLLLTYGVKTTGTGQRQYLHAIKLAEANGHGVVARILKDYRELTALERLLLEDDELMFSDLFEHCFELHDDALNSDEDSDLESSSSSSGWSGPSDWEFSDDE